MRLKNVLIIGATSAIAAETARQFAAQQASLFLVAKNQNKLQAVADDLRTRGAGRVDSFVLDVSEFERHSVMLEKAKSSLQEIDAALIAHGSLPDPVICEKDVPSAQAQFITNGLSVITLLIPLAEYFKQKKSGMIAVISSVAGDRGRQSNYLYGAAKGAVNVFTEGLRNRLYNSGVKVLTVKPGLVDTPMTAGLPKNILFSSPEKVGRKLHSAMRKGRDGNLYLPGYWRFIMLIVKLIPDRIFKRLTW